MSICIDLNFWQDDNSWQHESFVRIDKKCCTCRVCCYSKVRFGTTSARHDATRRRSTSKK